MAEPPDELDRQSPIPLYFQLGRILREEIRRSQADLKANTSLVNLAAQFGQATGAGTAISGAGHA